MGMDTTRGLRFLLPATLLAAVGCGQSASPCGPDWDKGWLAGVVSGCTESPGEPASCLVDTECTRGRVCQAQACAVRECVSRADCMGDQVCVFLQGNAARVCTARECAIGVGCPAYGDVCVEGVCVAGTQPTEDAYEATPEPDAIGDDTPASEGTTETVGPGPGGDCRPCTGAADCDQGYACATVGGGKYCLKSCVATTECKGGYTCYPVTTAGKNCLPLSYQCVECAYQGCGAGQSCDLVSGQCVGTVKICGKCTYDFQCGDGNRCYKAAQAATGVCTPECPVGDCGANAAAYTLTCGQNADGVKMCAPTDATKCQPCPAGQVVLGDGVTCAECTNSATCAAKNPGKPQCDLSSHTCIATVCASGQKKCTDGTCEKCCTDADCVGQGSGTCNSSSRTCDGVQDDCVKAGVDCTTNQFYPHCCSVNGTPQCCGCATDADCKADFPAVSGCACSGNMCVDSATSQQCGGTEPVCAANCASDADCPPSAAGGALSCKLPGGFCYDPAGTCDGSAACCPAGQVCFDIMSLLMGGLGGIPGGSTPGTGNAACSCSVAADCLGGAPCTSLSTMCAVPIIGTSFCPGGTPPATAPANLCLDITKMLGGLGI